jgi:sugar phosphate isomerase/epimerase
VSKDFAKRIDMQIFLSSVSLRETIKRSALTVYELPPFVVGQGYAGVEILDRQLVGFSKQAIERLALSARKAQCGIVLDIGCDLTLDNEAMWRSEITHAINSVKYAETLGAPVARISLGGQAISIQNLTRRFGSIMDNKQIPVANINPKPSLLKTIVQSQIAQVASRRVRMLMPTMITHLQAKLNRAIEALKIIMPYSQSCGINIAIENHWGITSKPDWIVQIVDGVGHSTLGVCLDFGNFPANVDRYKGIEILAKHAFHVQAKCWRFDEQGEETSIDFQRIEKILQQQGYDRIISIEYEGGKQELDACRMARELIQKHWCRTY